MTPADAHGPRPSYDYWRDHGAGWVEEYDRRKRTNVLYHIQELMLATYFTNSAPARCFSSSRLSSRS